ncbi:uncharacterized protein TNCV_2877561 [Trichonephila clavipes]|uniref:Uncharacterized protein n=1 Tax=Trichonephila clavipes TaxID=2585209 RepID=A0A8X6WDG7_TRICX|nr:uncharacterized protein TNCV_2877561 [Trichonephila clavipes]
MSIVSPRPSLIIFQDVKPLKGGKTFGKTGLYHFRTRYLRRLQEQFKKALKKHSQNSWTKRLEARNTTDNSLWQCQNFFRKKRSNIPNLNSHSGIANNDEQKANLLALTFKNNFIESKRPDDKISPIDDNIANALEDFLSQPPVAAVAEWYRHRIVAGFDTSSSPVPLKTRRVGQRCTLNLSRAETSSRWWGVVVRKGGCQLRCRPRHLTMVQNYVVRRQKPSCS